jgi:hypothetical protein
MMTIAALINAINYTCVLLEKSYTHEVTPAEYQLGSVL